MSVKQKIVYPKTAVGLLKLVQKHVTVLGIPVRTTMMEGLANSEKQAGFGLLLLGQMPQTTHGAWVSLTDT